ncbi:expressed unknown protein [Seminavis robusta]|uniref:CRAL-TRIO domain-containing protein n=1 Tax=Seminavis robusta TaxID=568900 RepID=A0A9N8DD24_9STRA|nr:expressed unknown protein [Seminavis robusta]|eukprot:Sro83_g044470.1 n/a (341) ;mRNA; r:93414-94436
MVRVKCQSRTRGILGIDGVRLHWQHPAGTTGTDCKPKSFNPKSFNHSSSDFDTSSEGSVSDDGDICLLRDRFPTLTENELSRFKTSFVGDNGSMDVVIQKLEEYSQFRDMYNLDAQKGADINCTDAEDWEWASKVAVQAAKTCQQDLIPGLEGLAKFKDRICKVETLPQLCFVHNNNDGTPALSKQGKPLIHYLPARLDLKKASGEIYALAIVLYVERKAERLDFVGKGAVLMADGRRGAGWPNHNALMVVSFLRILLTALNNLHPGRIGSFVIYPVPYACLYVFKMMKGWLPKAYADNVSLLNGGDGIKDPAPRKKLALYVEEDIMDKMEETRLANFDK